MIYLFLLCVCLNQVSANPLAKLLLQTRPNCNQNGYSSYNVPIQPNNQPYAPPFMTQNPMTNSNSHFGLLNELPVQIKLDDPNQSYLNKILTNPMLQSIINRNNNNFNQNSQDIGLQSNQGPPPNIVNNYYIIPPEYMQGNDDGIEIVKKIFGDQAIVCQNDKTLNTENENKTLQRSHNRQNEDKRRHKRPHNQEKGSIRNENNNNPQKRKRKNGQQNQNKGNQCSNSQNTNKNLNNKNHETVIIKGERNLPRKQNRTEESQPWKNGNRKRKRPRNKSKNEDINNGQQVSNDTFSSKNGTDQNEVEREPNLKEGRKHTNISINNKDEVIIRDIHNKFPGIPEDVIRRLLMYLRRQLRNSCQSTQPSNSKIKSIQSQGTEIDNKRRSNIQRNQSKRRKPKNNTDVVEFAGSSLSGTTDNYLITSTQSATKKDTLNHQVDDTTKYNNEQEHTIQPKIKTEVVETTAINTDLQTPKLGEEDNIIDLENDVDDYFPDFRFDKMYMSEDDYIRSLRDNRFYYTTDRNYNSEKDNQNEESSETYYEPFDRTKSKKDNNYQFQPHDIEDTLKRPDEDNFDYNDEVILRDYSDGEIKFQTPPILEYPDFETKPIIKYFDVEGPIYVPEHKSVDNPNDKSSTYSDAKRVNTPFKNRPKSDNIETVFARSKVATYGKPDEQDDTLNKKGNAKFDDTVLVYAKSFSDS